mgnify:CR=1 FL=1
MGAFVISKRFDDYYKFVFTSRKGKAIFTSFRYELKFECEEGIEYFKNAIDSVVFEKEKSSGGKYYFKIILENFEKPERRPNIYKLRGDEKFKYFLE